MREAVRIRLRDADGTVGLGEALPLPGYSRDDAATAQRVLGALAARAAAAGGLAVPEAVGSARRATARLVAALAPYAALLDAAPSARFALECALVDLLARREGVGAARWLADGRALQRVPVSVLLPDDAPCRPRGAQPKPRARPHRAQAEDRAVRPHVAGRG